MAGAAGRRPALVRQRPPETWASRTTTADDIGAADAAAEGRLTILCAETSASRTPEWRRDLYSGYEWPLVPSSRLALVRDDGSDIRTVWELSRCYHFAWLGKAWGRTGDTRYGEAFAGHVRSFIEQNPPALGPHWASPMDVAIRIANWCVAAYLFRRAPVPTEFWAELLAELRTAAEWVERHLEWHPRYRGNHYVSNLVGLLYAGTLFRAEPWGRRWIRMAARELARELAYQVRSDGVAFEASIGYHRLHTELFTWAGELLRANAGDDFDGEWFDARLARMVDFIGTYLQPDGSAPLVGDADDGRLHALSAQALREPRRHALGLPERWQAGSPGDGAYAFPGGGFFVLRSGRDHAVVRCGPVGINGAGSHDHCDQLGFELVLAGIPFVTDSGTYAYTRDLAARHRFRSTAAHSVVQIGGEEQNPIVRERPWRTLEDRTRAQALECGPRGADLVFSGRHFGYAHRASRAVHQRSIRHDPHARAWYIEDEITGEGTEHVCWRLHLAGHILPRHSPTDGESAIHAALNEDTAARIALAHPTSLRLRLEKAAASHRYGEQHPRPLLVLEGTVALPVSIRCSIRLDGADE